ncbi:hypothetical protein [Paraburkholderia bryophila]|uniref:Uncharacterized protein n=1 Tax=Paraburkholderia bryophila TaxID=420952 RepID=A0A329BFB0_9BURK|nr:hypothetical protein [Paraburkholderia bryophila]RAS21513.1 hypothetical protein BX591_12832 [Paraburkholderia bryophila]
MRLSIIGRCGNCQSITSRVTADSDDYSTEKRNRQERSRQVYQCRECSAKGVKPIEREKKKSRTELPRHIEDALAGAGYVMRSSNGEGFPRVVVTIPAFGSMMLGGEGGEDIVPRIDRAWPGLDDAQVTRVIQHINAGCKAAIRAMTQLPGRPKKRWPMDDRQDYPIKTERDI